MNQCAICLTKSTNVVQFCEKCNIHTHRSCFYNYWQYRNKTPECIICKNKCKKDDFNVNTISTIIYNFIYTNKEQIVIDVALYMIYSFYIFEYIQNSLYDLYQIFINELMIGTVYINIVNGCIIAYLRINNIHPILIVFILNCIKIIYYISFEDKILEISILQVYNNQIFYQDVLPHVIASGGLLGPLVYRIYKWYLRIKQYDLFSCKEYIKN